MTIEVGQVFKDNDPRMPNRRIEVLYTFLNGDDRFARCVVNGQRREVTINQKRMFTDGKVRRTGFSLVSRLEHFMTRHD